MKLEHLALAEPLAATGDGLTFDGYAAVFDLPSEDMGGYKIVLRPGAFSRSLNSKRDIRMYLNHDDNIVLASTRAGTLNLAQDDHGLKAMAKLPDNEWGRPVADAVARGDIYTMSIGFNSVTKSDVWSDDHSTLFKSELVLHEVSPITSVAAFPQTTATVFALAERVGVEGQALAEAIEKLSSGDGLLADEVDLLVKAATESFAVWDTAYVNDLPDSAFLYVEDGGSKDDSGKTVPRSLRHFPVRNAAGEVDMPHLRNAMSRIPQSNLPQSVQDRCMAAARRLMDAQGGGMASVIHAHELALLDLRQRAV